MPSVFRLIPGAVLCAGLAYSQRETPSQIKLDLDACAAAIRDRARGASAEKEATAGAILDQALASDPTDYSLLDRKRDLDLAAFWVRSGGSRLGSARILFSITWEG